MPGLLSDLDYDSVDRFRVFADGGGVDVLPPTSGGWRRRDQATSSRRVRRQGERGAGPYCVLPLLDAASMASSKMRDTRCPRGGTESENVLLYK